MRSDAAEAWANRSKWQERPGKDDPIFPTVYLPEAPPHFVTYLELRAGLAHSTSPKPRITLPSLGLPNSEVAILASRQKRMCSDPYPDNEDHPGRRVTFAGPRTFAPSPFLDKEGARLRLGAGTASLARMRTFVAPRRVLPLWSSAPKHRHLRASILQAVHEL